MTIANYIIYTLIFLLTPAGVVWLCRRYAWLEKLGPIMVLYAIGIILGNMPFVPEGIATLQDILPNVMIPLAIPMMLFGCNFTRKEMPLRQCSCMGMCRGLFEAGRTTDWRPRSVPAISR